MPLQRQLILAAVMFVSIALHAQELSVGKLLVATKKSRDPDLGRAVILLVHFDGQGVIGLMLNRPSKVPLSDVLPELKNAKSLVYAGGPVTIGVRAVCRGTAKPEQAVRVLDDMFMVSIKPLLASVLAGGACRVYAGYTGWSASQLKGEVSFGLWRVLPATAAVVFDPHPEELWAKLNAIR